MSDTTTDPADVEDTATTPTNDDAPPDGSTTDVEPDDTTEHDDDERGPAREAAKYRRQLRNAETERDELRNQLGAQRRAVIDWRAANAANGAVDPQLLDAAGIDIGALVDPDTGNLDMILVDSFIEQTATKFRVQRSVKPNMQQGQPSLRGSGASWTDVIKQGAKSS